MSRSPSLAEVLDTALSRRLGELHTCLPGRVESYDASKQTVDVQPLVQAFALQEDGTTTTESLPVLSSVPLIFPGGGGFRATYPVASGDTVLVVFAEASLDAWQPRGGVVAPPDTRRHHLADAVAIAGLHDNSKAWTGASTSAATWGKDGGPQVVARSNALELGGDDSNPPTEALVLGTTYRSAEDTFLQSLSTACQSALAAVAAAATALSTAATANAVPMVGGAVAAPSFAIVVTQLGTVAAQLGAIQAATTTFKAQGSTFLSQKVTTK